MRENWIKVSSISIWTSLVFRISCFFLLDLYLCMYERISLFLTTMYICSCIISNSSASCNGPHLIVMLSSKPYVIIITHWFAAVIYIKKKRACTMAVQQCGKKRVGGGGIRTCGTCKPCIIQYYMHKSMFRLFFPFLTNVISLQLLFVSWKNMAKKIF